MSHRCSHNACSRDFVCVADISNTPEANIDPTCLALCQCDEELSQTSTRATGRDTNKQERTGGAKLAGNNPQREKCGLCQNVTRSAQLLILGMQFNRIAMAQSAREEEGRKTRIETTLEQRCPGHDVHTTTPRPKQVQYRALHSDMYQLARLVTTNVTAVSQASALYHRGSILGQSDDARK